MVPYKYSNNANGCTFYKLAYYLIKQSVHGVGNFSLK